MTRVFWTKAEDDLIALWPQRTDAQIAAMIPRRTVQAVTMRRKRLGRVRRRKSGLAARVGAIEEAVLELNARIMAVEARKGEYKADGVGLGEWPPNGGGQVRPAGDSGPLQRRRKVLAEHGQARAEALHD